MTEEVQDLESFAQFLIKKNLIENNQVSQDSETLTKFYHIYQSFQKTERLFNEGGGPPTTTVDDTFSATGHSHSSQQNNKEEEQEEVMPFETKAIFTLADFLKQLQANEYYDIASKFYSEWQDEAFGFRPKLERLCDILKKAVNHQKFEVFYTLKSNARITFLEQENLWLRERLEASVQENDILKQERNILEFQAKKRNINRIQPLRSNSRIRSGKKSSQDGGSLSGARGLSKSMRPPSFVNTGVQLDDSTSQHSQSNLPHYEQKHMTQLRSRHGDFYGAGAYIPNYNPNLRNSNSRQKRDPKQEVYDRLSKSQKKFNPQMLDLQKEREELRQCTFHPETNFRSQILVERQNLNYQDKDQLCNRLYKHAETKGKYLQSLKALKDHVELRECTFHPERITASRSGSPTTKQDIDGTYTRLHQYHETQQRRKLRQETLNDKQFKENHPFQPNRIAKQKESSKTRENSKQRAERMYQEWKQREEKMEKKRKEIDQEEDKMKKLFMHHSNSEVQQSRKSQSRTQRAQLPGNMANVQSPSYGSQRSLEANRVNELYSFAKGKDKKQEALREKVYKEQGYTFKPSINISTSHHGNSNDTQDHLSRDVVQRTYDFLEKKEMKIRELAQKAQQNDFRPQRETSKSRLSQQVNEQAWSARGRNAAGAKHIVDQLLEEGHRLDEKKEKLRQQYAVDPNCTFKPQLGKKTSTHAKPRAALDYQSNNSGLSTDRNAQMQHYYYQNQYDNYNQLPKGNGGGISSSDYMRMMRNTLEMAGADPNSEPMTMMMLNGDPPLSDRGGDNSSMQSFH